MAAIAIGRQSWEPLLCLVGSEECAAALPITTDHGPTVAPKSTLAANKSAVNTSTPRLQPLVSQESLGSRIIQGISAEGTRVIVTYPEGLIGNDRPLRSISEIWSSSADVRETRETTRDVRERRESTLTQLISGPFGEIGGYVARAIRTFVMGRIMSKFVWLRSALIC